MRCIRNSECFVASSLSNVLVLIYIEIVLGDFIIQNSFYVSDLLNVYMIESEVLYCSGELQSDMHCVVCFDYYPKLHLIDVVSFRTTAQ
jgi:hypothetical protein